MFLIRMKKLKNSKAPCKEEVTGEREIKIGAEFVYILGWKLGTMDFEIDPVPEDGWTAVSVSLYKGKRERVEIAWPLVCR